ncbi:alpha-amylase family glycosyl hydrolase [Sphingomonas sp.]|uniref:alpha-amylase family glycosyl hydrolase n=1 Tax=Sphingomonas sp. TaxID=28214 RepID=UPI003CC56AB5
MRPASMVWMALAALLSLGAMTPPATPWWRRAVIYEIYPRSFQDTDGDGIGDLNGITRRLPYLQRLGVDAIWIAPIYPSPQVDFGYDITNYRIVDRQFGTLGDLDRLIAAARTRRIHVVLDLVLNHTSDQHGWFRESASSRTNPKADWYVWNDGVPADAPGIGAVQRRSVHDGRAPPNNWTSGFGGSAWTWAPARRQFYYHRFYRQQPDLNWRNPAVERAMLDTMRFWLDRGVAGFRLDAVTALFEDEQNRDEPEVGGVDAFGSPRLRHVHTDDLPQEHDVIRRMRTLVDGYAGDRVLIGETWVADAAAMRRWYGTPALDELQLPMDMFLGFGGPRYSPAWFRPRLVATQSDFGGGRPLFVFDNHDSVRSIDKFADGVHDLAIAKGIAAILYLSRATALTYYGAEIGMRTRPPARREDVRDPVGLAGWPQDKGRDGERTPMQWSAGPQAGFSTAARPWLPLNPDVARVNAESEWRDPGSLLNWTARLIALRRSEPALRDGAMTLLERTPPDVLAWLRASPGGGAVLVALNMSARPQVLTVSGGELAEPLAASDPADTRAAAGQIVLPPFATWVGRVGTAAHR